MKYYTTLINASDALLIAEDKNTVFLDCRFYLAEISKGRKEYIEGHIPGACYMDLTHDLSSPVIKGITGRHPLPHPALLAQSFRNAGINQASQVVVYDQSNGAYAARAWWLLRWLGHESVALMDGGYKEWLNLNGSSTNQWNLADEGDFEGNVNMDLIVTREMLMNGDGSLVDSREYKRYTGEHEPIDPVAGHIPGAVCIPFADNTTPEGKWISKENLASRFADLETGTAPVFYCGSGVTACHNVLAYKIATGLDARLYPGSWSEWINYHTPA
jgi:thiosulfate/3-mercaptopyruvate sulfurtransferase